MEILTKTAMRIQNMFSDVTPDRQKLSRWHKLVRDTLSLFGVDELVKKLAPGANSFDQSFTILEELAVLHLPK